MHLTPDQDAAVPADSRLPVASPQSRVWPSLEGIAWLVVTGLLLSQAWIRGINLVALIGCFLAALWLLNLLWVAGRRRLKELRLQRRIDGPVFARQPFTVTLGLENPTNRGQPGLRVVDRGSHHGHVWFVPLLRPKSRQISRYQAMLPRRGRYRWPALVLSTGYPFGLARRVLTYTLPQETIVLPQLGRLHRGRLRQLLQSQPPGITLPRRPLCRHPVAQAEFYGLREFRTGDSPRWIHWRTTARVGELMVREFEEPPLDNLVLILDPWLPPARESEVWTRDREEDDLLPSITPYSSLALELAVRLAATVCWEWCRNPGARLALAIAGPRPVVQVAETGMNHVIPLLESLALVRGHPQPDLSRLITLLTQTPLPAGPVLLVSTRSAGWDRALADALHRLVTLLDVSQPLAEVFEADGD